jgi:CheY-like chemotaxis protein
VADLTSGDSAISGPVPAPARPLRILVADDDHDNVLMLMEVLRDEGHETKGVYDGDAVIDAVTLFKPDVVLLDIGMPQRTGYELARYLRKRFGEQGITLIAVTGWKKHSDKILATLAGFDHHIAKPYEPQMLVDLLAKVPPQRDR